MAIRYKIGITLLVVQVILIVYARFVPERFFCWAPFDEHTYLEINVEIDGENLTRKDIANRYRYISEGWEPRSIYNVFSIIKQYEASYGEDDNAEVKVKYSVNGKPARIWNLMH